MSFDMENYTPHEYALSSENNPLFEENCRRSPNEQHLFIQWQYACRQWEKTSNSILQLQIENQRLSTTMNELCRQVEALQVQISGTKQLESAEPDPAEALESEIYFETDEEELAKETE